MAPLDLQKVSSAEPTLDHALIAYNFERIDVASEVVKDVVQARVNVTGSVTLVTGLASVEGVVASLSSDSVAGAAFVNAYRIVNSNQIVITVWSSTFVLSTIPAAVTYIAVGVMAL